MSLAEEKTCGQLQNELNKEILILSFLLLPRRALHSAQAEHNIFVLTHTKGGMKKANRYAVVSGDIEHRV